MSRRDVGGIPWRGPLLGLLLITFAASGCNRAPKAAAERPAPPVSVVVVKRMDVPIEIERNASTRAINQVTISARVKGFLKEILFKEGSEVKKGQLLMIIDENPYQVALAKANAQLKEAEAGLAKAKQSKSREVAKAKVDLSVAGQTLESVQDQRAKLLFGRNAASKGDLDLADAQLLRANAQVEADKASLSQTNADYDTDILEARAKLDQAKAAVDDAQINLGYCRMSAPIDGRIGEALVKVGNLVGQTSDTQLATIQQLDPMSVDIEVPSVNLAIVTRMVEKGLDVSIAVKRKNNTGEFDRKYTGHVDFIDNSVARSSSNVLVKATVPNPDKSMLPGEFATMRVVVDVRKDAIVVPEKAVMQGQAGTTVYIVAIDIVKLVSVTLDEDKYHGMRVVKSGLSDGDKVIVEGVQLVRAGMKVAPTEVPFPMEAVTSTTAVTPASEQAKANPETTNPQPATK